MTYFGSFWSRLRTALAILTGSNIRIFPMSIPPTPHLWMLTRVPRS